MNRRGLVLGTVAVAVAIFGLGALMVQQNQAEPDAAIAVTEGTPLIRPYAPIIGDENAPVTIVEFFDPACEACRAFHPVVKDILKEHAGKVRVIVRYAAFHKGSDEAVKILEAARLQGIFEPILEALLSAQPKWASHGSPRIELAWDAAATAGLDVTAARAVMDSPEILRRLQQEQADIETIGVKQTPTFFVDGLPLRPFGADNLRKMVKSQVTASSS
ncbi:MAG: DsbA family protein [Gammaproteobacteria bacterium]|nr:DsbA family protein [Gammaproteobacteria bacterium]